MRRKKFNYSFVLFVIFLLGISFQSFAQSVVSGSVSTATGEPLEGVSVVLKGTKSGTTTDARGFYTLNVPDASKAILVFSFNGYESREMIAGTDDSLNVNLTADFKQLDQVVVVGYGSQKKVNLTGAVSTIDKEVLLNRPVSQTSQALQGQMPGVTVTQNFGLPGGDGGTVRIRGLGTLGNNEPLVLIDGIPGGLNDISPNDIENLSVLKDAAAASIYGSRAANGVILITTRRGRKNENMTVEYSGIVTMQKATNLPKLVTGEQYMLLRNEEYKNSGQVPPYTTAFIDEYRQKVGTEPWFNTDWVDLAMKDQSWMNSHNLTFKGGGEKLSSLVSLSFVGQDGLIENSDFNRKSVRFNNTYYATNRLTFTMDGFMRREETEYPYGNGTGPGPLFRMMYETPAIYPGLWADGSFGEGWQGANPYAYAKAGGTYKLISNRLQLNLRAAYKIFDWLTAEVAYAPKYLSATSDAKVKKYEYKRIDGTTGIFPTEANRVIDNANRTVENFYQGLLRYNKTFGKHSTGAMVGIESIDNHSEGFFASRQNYVLQDYMVLNSGDPNTRDNGNAPAPSEWWLFSQFGRVNYAYDNRYLLEFNLRYDGSSRFSSSYKQYGLFPSVSVGWRVSEEPFMKNVKLINNLKFRGSWGQLGNQEAGSNYPSLSLINLNQPYYFGGTSVTGAAQTVIANAEVTWETSTVLNGGIDFTILDNRLSGSFDIYKKNTKDILYTRDIPALIGLNAAPQNIAEVQNTGWDLLLGWHDRINKFRYGVDFVMSDVHNKVINLNGKPVYGRNAIFEGEEYQAFYGYEVLGIYRSDKDLATYPKLNNNVKLGDLIYKDQNGDGIIDATNDKKIIGSNIPRLTYGITLSAGYGGFDLSVFLQGVGRKNVYYIATDAGSGGNYASFQLDRFVPDDPSSYESAKWPRLVALNSSPNIEDNSFYLLDASYMRCKNATLSYSLPAGALRRMKMKELKIFVSGTNLFTVDNLSINNIDPEAPSSTTGTSYAPNTKGYSLGLNVRF